jgi:hypothetical protein
MKNGSMPSTFGVFAEKIGGTSDVLNHTIVQCEVRAVTRGATGAGNGWGARRSWARSLTGNRHGTWRPRGCGTSQAVNGPPRGIYRWSY